ncbi:MAG: spermidine/putrescine ABC transporter substrate-binding protein [Oscillospiraceae bacterium]|jgi:spermidine/putrescine-binding protein|nr:spermidine/putrescine ABC transporter substrate-binding protein [Oscillospiraceae bacterium]
MNRINVVPRYLTKVLAMLLTIALAMGVSMSALADGEVNVYNWEDYISEGALALFEEETGIKVNYMRFTTNEDMLVQVRADPTNYDVIFPSDYIIERLISEELLEELDWGNIPNASNVLGWLNNPSYDPDGRFSVPYMWGTVGILYNTKMVNAPIDSWTALWDEEYKNNVFMMDSIRDTIGVTLKMLGYSMNERSQEALDAVKDRLIEQKRAGIVKAYQVDETKDKMIAGEAAIGVVWSGDAAYAMGYNEDLAYVVPNEGSNVWVDGMCVPKGARNKANAETFIDFMCRPDVALLNFEEIWYCTPNAGTIALLDEETLQDETIFPPQDVIDRCEFFQDISSDITRFNRIWLAVKSAR